MFSYLISPWTKWPHFADDIFKCIFLNENVRFLTKISLTFVPKVQLIITNADSIHWRIYAGLGGDELMLWRNDIDRNTGSVRSLFLLMAPVLAWIDLIPAWISNNTHYKVWNEITYPLPNFYSASVGVPNGWIISSHSLFVLPKYPKHFGLHRSTYLISLVSPSRSGLADLFQRWHWFVQSAFLTWVQCYCKVLRNFT